MLLESGFARSQIGEVLKEAVVEAECLDVPHLLKAAADGVSQA